MRRPFHGGRDRQLGFLDHRLRELEDAAASAARELISASLAERRSASALDRAREVTRLRRERDRLRREPAPEGDSIAEEDVERHFARIEHQLRDVLTDRDRWFRESLAGQRRRREDFRWLGRLKEEKERLTAELLRCAGAPFRNRHEAPDQQLRRLWQMLRLSGT